MKLTSLIFMLMKYIPSLVARNLASEVPTWDGKDQCESSVVTGIEYDLSLLYDASEVVTDDPSGNWTTEKLLPS